MTPSISITFAHGERGTERAIALGRAAAADDLYGPMAFGDIPVDVRFSLECQNTCEGSKDGFFCPEYPHCRAVNVELKEISDFWASKATGHLGQQILQMISTGQPGFVAVYGSLQDVLAGVPKVKSVDGKPHARSQHDIASDVSTARAFCADAAGCNVPVHFLSPNYGVSAKWILSYAKNILLGPNLASWLPRFPVDAQAYGMLCSVHGIGDVAAKKLLQAYGGMGQIANEAKYNPAGLQACIGKAKAAKLVEVLG